MTADQVAILAILALTVVMFVWGRWRHDLIAMAALLAAVLAGVVPEGDAFAGFGHPAVITVACVLILSGALQSTGAVDWLTRLVVPRRAGVAMSIAMLAGLAALLSGFMNNVGALALLMPVAMQNAGRLGVPAGQLLMPLAFGSILGGMTTLIGTPPNLIVSGFRTTADGNAGFAMFDFLPVGASVAVVGVLFIALAGRYLVPARRGGAADGFETGAYLTEVRVPESSDVVGMSLGELERMLDDTEAQVLGLVRGEAPIAAPSRWRVVRADDILLIEADPAGIADAISRLGLQLEEEVRRERQEEDAEEDGEGRADPAAEAAVPPERGLQSDGVGLAELVVRPNALLVGRSATDIRLRTRFGINLLAIGREGVRSAGRLRDMRLLRGDVLLVQGQADSIADFAGRFGLVPLAQRELRLPDGRKAAIAAGLMAAAIGAAAFGLVPAAIGFAAAVLAVVVLGIVPVRNLYEAVDWPVVVLLAALIPVAGAIASTGAADLVAQALLAPVVLFHPAVALTLILVVTMTLSDFMNNAGTAAVMAPVAISTATQLGVATDPFLMAVAIGASCAFLTPIGHQNNTLILGPGGFRFGDYWRMGLPLEAIVVAVSVPMILLVWPL